MMLGTIPPIPIAAFGDKQFFERKFALRFTGPGCVRSIERAGVVEIIPRAVILGSADPYVEVRVDPGTRDQRGQLAEITVTGDGFGHGNCLDARFALQRIVETA